MNCAQACERLSAFTDGELTADAKATVERHLRDCASCRAELSRLELVAAELDRLTDIETKPYFEARLRARRSERNRRTTWTWARRFAVPAGVALVLLAAVAGARLGTGLYRCRSSSASGATAARTGTLDLLDGPGGSLYVAGGSNE